MTSDDPPAATPGLAWPDLPPWHRDALLAITAQRARLPHALLLYGPAGIGKHALALHIAQALLCEAPAGEGGACGACASCHYAVAGQHPDLLRLELTMFDPDEGDFVATEIINVGRIRALIEFVQLTSHRQRAKVAVIAPAERMNEPAANALLKTLEEPPAGTYLLLVSDHPGRLRPTVVSRCRKVALGPPSGETAAAWLAGQGVADAGAVLAQAGGAPLAAMALADPAVQQERRVWLDALSRPEALPVIALAARIDGGGRDERKARLERAIDWLLAWTADLARITGGEHPQRNPDLARPLHCLGSRVARAALFRYHRTLLQQRALLAHPLQPRLVAEALLVQYRSLFTV